MSTLRKALPGFPLSGFDYRALVLPVFFVAFWALAHGVGWVDTRLIPSPLGVVKTAWGSIFAEDFLPGLWGSLYRDVSGFVIGGLFGVATGVALGLSRWLDAAFNPALNALKQISLFAWLPLITSWFGYDDGAKILFIAASTFYPVAVNTFEGVRGVTRQHLEVARVFRFSRTQLIFRLLLPAAAPRILTGLQMGLVFAWLATIGSEFLLANWGNGLGNIIIHGREALDVGLVIWGLIIVGIVGSLLNRLARRAESRLLGWRGTA
ncbi:MAG: ABC transporter permease [Azoarcus sp.]|jgi:sulfonate transport system permease protein|nr:ABC transporter permease [Azoarcus sp.]